MLTDQELSELLKDLESDRVERTVSYNNTDKFSQAVCAFANDLPNHNKPGYLILGAADDGSASGLKVTDDILRNLGGLRSDGNIQPIPQINVSKITVNNANFAVVEVFPSHFPPVRYKGNIFIRIGPRRDIATEQEERVLTEKRINKARSFDSCAVATSSLSDIIVPLFVHYRQQVVADEIIKANHRSIEEQLASLRFYDNIHSCVTNAGLLVFGKNPRFFMPGAYVQYLRIDGTKLTDKIIDQAEIAGDLFSVMRELDVRIKSQIISILQKVSALQEKMLHDYPQVAIRELLTNAIMHRDYQSNAPIKFYWYCDRIEIQNAGGLYGAVTIEKITTVNDYRNPVIAEAMKGLGYVNRYGYGIQNAKNMLQMNGNPQLELSSDNNVFLAVIRK